MQLSNEPITCNTNYLDMQTWSRRPAKLKQTIRIVKKGDLIDFEHGMVLGARCVGLSIPETTDLQGFPLTTVSTETGPKRENIQ